MEAFDPEDGPVLLGPWPDRAAVEAVVDGALAAAGHRRVARYDRGFTAITRLYAGSGQWWLEPGAALAPHLPAGLAGFAAMALYSEDDEWGSAVGAEIFRVRSDGDGSFEVGRALPDHRPADPPDVTDLMEEGLRRAAGLADFERAYVFHEPEGPFSCRVVERTYDALEGLGTADWRVERGDDGIRVVTPSGPLPPWRPLTEAEWDEVRTALEEAPG